MTFTSHEFAQDEEKKKRKKLVNKNTQIRSSEARASIRKSSFTHKHDHGHRTREKREENAVVACAESTHKDSLCLVAQLQLDNRTGKKPENLVRKFFFCELLNEIKTSEEREKNLFHFVLNVRFFFYIFLMMKFSFTNAGY